MQVASLNSSPIVLVYSKLLKVQQQKKTSWILTWQTFLLHYNPCQHRYFRPQPCTHTARDTARQLVDLLLSVTITMILRKSTQRSEVICDAMNTYIPSKIVRSKVGDKAWFDDKCRRLALFVKDASITTAKNSISPENKDTFVQATKTFNRAERKAKINCGHSDWTFQQSTQFTEKDKTNILCQTFAQECRRDDGDHQPQGATVQPQVLLDKTNFKPKEIKKRS